MAPAQGWHKFVKHSIFKKKEKKKKNYEFSVKQGKKQKHFHFSSLIRKPSVIEVLGNRMTLFSVARCAFLKLFISPFIYLQNLVLHIQ